jgi:SNF2 family DNA or RNA helicase
VLLLDAPKSGKKGRLVVHLKDASDAARQAAKSLLTARDNPTEATVTIGVEDFPCLGRVLETLKAPEAVEAEITPEGEVVVNDFFARRDHLLDVKKVPVDPTWLQQVKGWKTTPYPDQLQCVRFHTERERSLEGGETGIGKTLILLYTFLYWKTLGLADKAIIICVNTGKLDWEKEVRQHTDLTPFMVGNGSAEVLGDLQRFERSGADVLIIHYEALLTNAKSKADVFSYLKKMKFGFVAIDEVHTLKNPKAIRHKRVLELMEGWKDAKLVCATGTAIDGNPKSAWAPLKLVEAQRDRHFPSYYDFCRHFIEYGTKFFYRREIKVEIGFKNLSHLKPWLDYTSIRYLKADVLGRPSKIWKTRIVTLKGAQLELYNQVKAGAKDALKSEDATQISLVGLQNLTLRLRQILNHPRLIDGLLHFEGDSAKYLELDDVIEEILSNPEAQILVWTAWRAAVDNLVQRYKQYGAIAFYGGSDERTVRDAVESKKARVVVAIPEKAGTSVDFLKVCRTAVYLEKPWHLSLYRQSLDRIDRRANTDPALIISIDCENSIDQVVNAVLHRRQDIFDALTVEDDKLVSMGKEELLKFLQ